MKYKDLVENYFDVSNNNVDNEIKFNIVKEVSSSIKNSIFYRNLDFNDKKSLDKYINRKVMIFENNRIGFDKVDSIVSGIEIPTKFLLEKIVYDRSNKGIKIPVNIAEVIKNQVRAMKPYILSKMYENNGGYRLVFENENDIFEITVRGR
tara:strand:+ start:552 stop:1001 length:450 start_codon:yes stop_codon:yes gene_type:complete